MNGDHSLAVHALVYLDHRATHLPSQILAENICTNAARVRKVMRPLASAGLIATKEGAEGGYALARPAAEIRLGAIVRLLEDGQPLVDCFAPGGGDCTIDGRCRLKARLRAAEAAFHADLDRSTLADIALHPGLLPEAEIA